MNQVVFVALATLAVFASAAPAAPLCEANSCPHNGMYYQSFNKCLIAVNHEGLTDASEAKCVEHGGHLVSIHNTFQNTDFQNFVLTHLPKQPTIIGLESQGSSNTFVWTDGTAVDYTNFHKANSTSDSNVYVLMDHRSGMWFDYPKTQTQHMHDFVCAAPATSSC